jgi:hypothetical protein
MCVMIYTHSDISHGVSVVSKFIKNHSKAHWQVIKWILYYLRSTAYVGLIYDKDSNIISNVEGFVNLDYASDLDSRRWLTDYVFILLECAIGWKAILQSTIVLSTTKTGYITLIKVVKKVLWLRGLVNNLGFSHELIFVHCDSQSVVHPTKIQMYH